MISIYIYIRNRSICREAPIPRRYISFMTHPDITGVTSMWPYQEEIADEN